MGDRGNIIMKYEGNNKIYFYTHWSGSSIDRILKDALIRGESRWGDEAYLARIIFCEMIKDGVLDTTSFGITPYVTDGEDKMITVDLVNSIVEKKDRKISFEEYVK